ncbi:acid phosphatase [Nesidiocoris tenuis]|uniref:acid phosphatase n=1 Tax=Nesidiocoris tenuis TaxID=355587 RepID=A0ABN7AIS9_9HEMI|nr:acid phosphatase [Nesidiocoris tenuis]
MVSVQLASTKHSISFLLFGTAMILATGLLIYIVGFSRSHPAYEKEHDALEDVFGPVQYINILYRHGARTPDSYLPTDPYNDIKFWPEGFGQLTQEGILQHYNLGGWLAKRYSHLLPNDWKQINKAIRVVSTDWDRTLASASAEMEGMFPIQSNSDEWKGLRSYPVPIHCLTDESDALLQVTKSCPKYAQLIKTMIKSKQYLDLFKNNEKLVEYVKLHSGKESLTLSDFQDMYSTFSIEKSRNYILPKWADKIFPEKIMNLVAASFEAETWTVEMKRLRGGPMVKQFLGNFKTKLAGSSLNISMYSAHDTTISAFLNTIDAFDSVPPPFASMVIIELRQLPKNDPFVTVWYKTNSSDPRLLSLPSCGDACRLSQLESLLKPVIPENWDEECKIDPINQPN